MAPFCGLLHDPETELYVSGAMGGPKNVVQDFPTGRIAACDGPIPDTFWRLMIYRGVRYKRADSLPWLCKHAAEFARTVLLRERRARSERR